MTLLLLTSILALLSPKAAEQMLLSSKPAVKVSVQVVAPPPPVNAMQLTWDFPPQQGVAYSTMYWGTNHASYTFKTNVPYPGNTAWITSAYMGQLLYLAVTCTSSNTVSGTTNLSESPPSSEIMTFVPSINLTNSPDVNFSGSPKFRIETATSPAGPWSGYLNTNWNPASANQFFRINFSR